MRPTPASSRCARRTARSPRRSSTTHTSGFGPPFPPGRIAPVGERPAMVQWVYDFAEGSKDMRDLLGGKGANVAEMTRILGPDRVPAGFTITTEACVRYMDGRELPDGLDEQVDAA